MMGRVGGVIALVVLCVLAIGCGRRSSEGGAAGENGLFQVGFENGVAIANQHLQTLEQHDSADREQVLRDAMLPWYLKQFSDLEEFPPDTNGHEIARGQIKGYKSVMGKKYRLPK